MKTFFFTFGVGSPLAKCFVRVQKETEELARLQMYEWFTTHWASIYPEDGFAEGVAKYGLIEIPVPKDVGVRLMTNHDELHPQVREKLHGN
jgi:hypothetical protein